MFLYNFGSTLYKKFSTNLCERSYSGNRIPENENTKNQRNKQKVRNPTNPPNPTKIKINASKK